jgi:hypothetical protein
MIKPAIVTLLLFTAGLVRGAEPFSMTLEKEYSPNLLQNPGFEELDARGNPKFWLQQRVPNTHLEMGVTTEGAIGKYAAYVNIINSVGVYGYWSQHVKIQNAGRYCSVVALKADCDAVLALNPIGGGRARQSISRTVFADGCGAKERTLLANFIDPAYLLPISDTDWNYYSVEFSAPAGTNTYDFTVGAKAANSGLIKIDDAYCGLAKYTLNGVIKGLGLKSIRIKDGDGKILYSSEFMPNKIENNIRAELPSRLGNYSLEITDTQGNVHKRGVP